MCDVLADGFAPPCPVPCVPPRASGCLAVSPACVGHPRVSCSHDGFPADFGTTSPATTASESATAPARQHRQTDDTKAATTVSCHHDATRVCSVVVEQPLEAGRVDIGFSLIVCS